MQLVWSVQSIQVKNILFRLQAITKATYFATTTIVIIITTTTLQTTMAIKASLLVSTFVFVLFSVCLSLWFVGLTSFYFFFFFFFFFNHWHCGLNVLDFAFNMQRKLIISSSSLSDVFDLFGLAVTRTETVLTAHPPLCLRGTSYQTIIQNILACLRLLVTLW